jgi:RNA polymerase sigma factor (sigma-70 family)
MAASSRAGTPEPDGRDPADDGAVIAQSLHDPEQFAAVFRRHAADIHRYVVRRLGIGAADDVVAETFLAAFRLRSKYQLDRPDARPWLYEIATNLIGHHRRNEVRQYRALARAGIDPVTEPFTELADARVSASGQNRRLAAALAKLPAGHRDALLLVAWGGLSYEQAAVALGVPVGTVRSRLSRARGMLRQALTDADWLAGTDMPGSLPAVGGGNTAGGQPPEVGRGESR